MPVSVTELFHGAVLVMTASGHVTGKELLEGNTQLIARGAELGKYLGAFCDFDNITSADLPTVDVRKLAEQDHALARLVRAEFSVAILTRQEAIFGLARMWQVFVEGTAWHVLVARSRQEAEEWMRLQTLKHFSVNLPEFPAPRVT